MKTTAVWILAGIFGGIAVLLAQTNHLTFSIWFGGITVVLLVISLFVHRIESKNSINSENTIGDLNKKREVIYPEKLEQLIVLIKDSCDSKYNLRNTHRNDKISHLLSVCGASGFSMANGTVIAGVVDLYTKELHIFSDTLMETITESFASEKFTIPAQPLISLSQKMISNKSKELCVLFCNFIDKYFSSMNENQKNLHKYPIYEAFTKEAQLLIAKISTELEIIGEMNTENNKKENS